MLLIQRNELKICDGQWHCRHFKKKNSEIEIVRNTYVFYWLTFNCYSIFLILNEMKSLYIDSIMMFMFFIFFFFQEPWF